MNNSSRTRANQACFERYATLSYSGGFTLIELLVTVAIIGILVGIAIPQYASYRQRAFDARAKNDLFAAVVAQEAYFASKEFYVSCSSTADCKAKLPNLQTSAGIELQTTTVATDYFVMTSYHPQGSTTFTWNTANGGLQ